MGEKRNGRTEDETPVARRGALALSDSEEAEDDDDDKNGARRWLEL